MGRTVVPTVLGRHSPQFRAEPTNKIRRIWPTVSRDQCSEAQARPDGRAWAFSQGRPESGRA